MKLLTVKLFVEFQPTIEKLLQITACKLCFIQLFKYFLCAHIELSISDVIHDVTVHLEGFVNPNPGNIAGTGREWFMLVFKSVNTVQVA